MKSPRAGFRVPPETLDWLLEENNPSVRFNTLVSLLGRSPNGSNARDARRKLMARGPVPAILAEQQPDGGWAPRHRLYTSKYWGTVWTLLVLAELGADPDDPRVGRACEHVLESSWVPETGGFAVRPGYVGGDDKHAIPCLAGNMVFSLIRLGRLKDPRVQKSIEWIAEHMRYDDGDSEPPANHRYRRDEMCYGSHTCFHAVVKGLKALAEVPEETRSAAVRRCIRLGGEFMLRHRVYRSSRNPRRIGRAGWASFGFPNMWNTDALEILDILAALGFDDPRMEQALDLVEKKRDSRGRWKLDHTWNGKMQVNIERKGRPSKWVTLRALRALSRLSG